MTIAFLSAHLSMASGGIAHAVAGLAEAIAEREYCRVHIVGIRDPQAPDGWRQWQRPGVEIHALPQLGPRAFGAAPAMMRTLNAIQPSIVHIQGLWMYPSLASLRWHARNRRPYIIAPHGMLDSWALGRSSLRKRLVYRWFEAEHLHAAACLHALNAAEAAAMRSLGLNNPICIVPNGVQLPDLGKLRRPTWLRRELLFLGRIDAKKGVRELLMAWSVVAKEARRAGWRLTLTGWGDPAYEQAMRRLVQTLGLDEDVVFTGPRFGSEKEEALRSARAFILPSHSEGMPLAVLEAWSYRLPVIITAQCNLPEGFAWRAALEVTADSVSIADGLHRLFEMTDRELDDMGKRGRQLVEERFTWERLAVAMSAVYNWILGGGALPSNVRCD